LIEKLPLKRVRRMLAGRERLNQIIYGLIETRRKTGADGSDLLSMLIRAQDVEGDGAGMSDQQVRDEALTIFLAGHETTANAMSWTWYLLAQHPEVERRLYEEVSTVLQGRLPTAADYPKLPYTEKVITESMRIYPPAWIVARRAINEQKLGDYTIPPRAGALRSRALDARVQGRAAPLRLFPIRRRTAPMHRRRICLDGSSVIGGRNFAALENGTPVPGGDAGSGSYAQAEEWRQGEAEE
jgi:hypothetical protein